ncbi:hypothetical protein [Flammeovirga kamogawensis]|uniref:Uncharacterized protein n=1 Tax=Flammeovirga kamogawensis TaxID=373891 RepID=A0ABX8GUG7_9BACT|nr:hypothetical protein [Flammeovirga kamogawensis]MBB6462460.1 hypothetical protein [Flammeovirga kamogawensis]QWG06802.1 hypothetical protein KM029_16050 [Flammeovirga kamogawensis]TRX68625.1 hypothetical protein EO216_11045 [Flammeovirga kamogawensis]
MLQDKRDYIKRLIKDLEKLMLRFQGLDWRLHRDEIESTIDKYITEIIKISPDDNAEEMILKVMDLSAKLDFIQLELLTDALASKGKVTGERKYLEAALRLYQKIEDVDVMTFSFVRHQKISELTTMLA